MPIILDVNTTSKFSNCINFKKMMKWLQNNKNAKIVYGGDKYINEMKLNSSLLKIISELNKINKVIVLCNSTVNQKANDILNLNITDLDDEHIFAISALIKINFIATLDNRLINSYNNNKKLLRTENVNKLKFFTGHISNLDMLT